MHQSLLFLPPLPLRPFIFFCLVFSYLGFAPPPPLTSKALTEEQASIAGLPLALTAAEARARRLEGRSGFPNRLLLPAPTAELIRSAGYDPTAVIVHDDSPALQDADAATLRQLLAATRWQLAAACAHAERAEAQKAALQDSLTRAHRQGQATRVRVNEMKREGWVE